jgi:rod shape-determining protein MreD
VKKFLLGVLAYIVFIILYFIQADFFSWFTIAGVSPNLFIMFILFLGLFTDNTFSIIIALITGITLDLVMGRTVGITAIMFCLVSIIASYFDKNFSKESKLTIMTMVVGMTVICETCNYLLNALILETPVEIVSFIKILLIEVLYNGILTIIFYSLFLKLGYKLEKQFKQKNILTRYF